MSAPDDSQVQSIGGYRIQTLAHKGPPRIYRAADARTSRDIRLVLQAKAGESDGQTNQWLQRCEAAMSLRHPAILPIYEVGIDRDWIFAAGAWPVGKTLVETLAGGPLSPRRAAVIARSLAEGLAYAHDNDYVHGDVRPDCVALGGGGSAVWIDFGVRRDAPPSTAAYAAPERLGDPPGPADALSDQYGLGCLLFEMLTGRTPYSGNREEIVAQALVAEDSPSPRNHDLDIDRDLDAICRRAIEPNPPDRYASCQDFADDLRRWLEGERVAARPQGRLRKWIAATPLLLAVLGASWLALGAIGYWAIDRQRELTVARDHAASHEASVRDRDQAATLAASTAEAVQRRDKEHAQRLATDLKERDRELTELRLKSLQTETKLKDDKANAETKQKEDALAREDLEASLYCESVRQSQRHWQENDFDRARARLDSCEPRDKKRTDHRDWEWHFLRRRYQPPKTFTLTCGDPARQQLEPRSTSGADLRTAHCAYSPNGSLLLHCVRDSKVTLWNALIGDNSGSTGLQSGTVCHFAVSPDGTRIATAGSDLFTRIWSAESGELLRTFRGHTDAITAVAFRPDGQMLATGGADKIVHLYNLAEDEPRRKIQAHDDVVWTVAFRPDGQLLATAGADGAIKFWDPANGNHKQTLAGHAGGVSGLAFSPDGQRLASAGADRCVRLWDANAGKEIRALIGHSRRVRSVAFRPDGQRLASAGDDRAVCVWSGAGDLLHSFPSGHAEPIHSIAYRPDGRQFATASWDLTLKLWDADRPIVPQNREWHGHTDAVTTLAISADGKRLATGGADKTVRLWDPQTGEVVRTLDGHSGTIRGLAFSANGERLASASDDGTVKLWDPATGQLARTLGGHTGAVNAVAFSTDGKRLATAGADGFVRIRAADTGEPLLTCNGHFGGTHCVAFSQDGKQLLTSGTDGATRFWNAETAEEMTGILNRVSAIRTVIPADALKNGRNVAITGYPTRSVYSPNGDRCAVIGRSGAITVFDTTFVLPTCVMEGHDLVVRCLAFSPNGRRLATADVEGHVRIWDCKTGREVMTLPAHAGAVGGLAFSRDGRTLYTAGADRVIRVWDGSPEEPAAKLPEFGEKR